MASNNKTVQIPDEMTRTDDAWPVVYLKAKNIDLWGAPTSLAYLVSDMLKKAIRRIHKDEVRGQALLKVHIGEPKCHTRMKPGYTLGVARFLRQWGACSVVAGDTTVAYTGPRGYKENPDSNPSKYLRLAQKHGWSKSKKSGTPFVVLDRPSTSKPGQFEFTDEQQRLELEGVNRFRDFYAAGGFTAADFVVNNAHLTLHGLAGLAGCVKSIAMGCSGLTGKLRMHQSLLPRFDPDRCILCGKCVKHCPEDALQIRKNDPCPTVDPQRCIGCGECEAVCALTQKAITLSGEEISDWQRGSQTLPIRMADYTIGLMNGRWSNTLHIMHMYAITERCDCLDIKQQPMLKYDLGFLVGKNPFAVDRLAGQLLGEALKKEKSEIDETLLRSADITAQYIRDQYGIVTDVPVKTMIVS